jgi:hypothetical protein
VKVGSIGSGDLDIDGARGGVSIGSVGSGDATVQHHRQRRRGIAQLRRHRRGRRERQPELSVRAAAATSTIPA